MNKQELIKHFEDLPYVSITQMGKKSFIDMIEQLDEPQKVTIPQFVADWIKKCKAFEHFVVSLSFALQPIVWEENNLSDKCIDWLMDANNQELFARAWLDGYEVEEEKRYFVKMKEIAKYKNYLVFGEISRTWFFASVGSNDVILTHTRKELEEAGFGWVFDCDGIEIEEVEE